jgi:hypothetical protein
MQAGNPKCNRREARKRKRKKRQSTVGDACHVFGPAPFLASRFPSQEQLTLQKGKENMSG